MKRFWRWLTGGLQASWRALLGTPSPEALREKQLRESWAALVLPDRAPTEFAVDLLAGASLAELERAALALPVPKGEIVGPLAARTVVCQLFLLQHSPEFSVSLHRHGRLCGTVSVSRPT